MAQGTIGTWWRGLLLLLMLMSGAALAWISARRRPEPALPAHSWSEPPPAPVAVEPSPAPAPAAASGPSRSAASPVPAAGVQPGDYPGSVLPLVDGSAPSEEYLVKGNAGSMRSHSTSSPYFGRTRAEVWFRSQEDAIAAGFKPWAPKK